MLIQEGPDPAPRHQEFLLHRGRIQFHGEHPIADLGFKLFFLSFVVLGSSIELSSLIDLSDAIVFIVAIPNLIGLYLLAPMIKTELIAYEKKYLNN